MFRTVLLRKLFDIRFLYKHCNFSHVCLLVKMASKTVTRSILLFLVTTPGSSPAFRISFAYRSDSELFYEF